MQIARHVPVAFLALVLLWTGALPCGSEPGSRSHVHRSAPDASLGLCGEAPDVTVSAPCPCGCEDTGSPSSLPGWALRPAPPHPLVPGRAPGAEAPARAHRDAPGALPDPVPIAIG